MRQEGLPLRKDFCIIRAVKKVHIDTFLFPMVSTNRDGCDEKYAKQGSAQKLGSWVLDNSIGTLI